MQDDVGLILMLCTVIFLFIMIFFFLCTFSLNVKKLIINDFYIACYTTL